MTLGWRTILRMWISLVTLSTSDWSLILSFSKILIATFSPVSTCVPSLTFPKVPCPSDLPLSNRRRLINFLVKLLTYDIMPDLTIIGCSSSRRLILVVRVRHRAALLMRGLCFALIHGLSLNGRLVVGHSACRHYHVLRRIGEARGRRRNVRRGRDHGLRPLLRISTIHRDHTVIILTFNAHEFI